MGCAVPFGVISSMNVLPSTAELSGTVPAPAVSASSSTTSVSTATAIVLSVPDPLTLGLPTEVALIVAVLVAESAAPAGTSTLTHTLVEAPAMTLGVVDSGVEQVESRMVVGKVAPVVDIE